MAFVNGVLGLQDSISQQSPFSSLRVIGESLLSRIRIPFFFVAIWSHLVETLTCRVHALFIAGARATYSERLVGDRDVFAYDGVVDKSEVWVEEGFVFAVDDGDGEFFMGCEGSDLAPVTVPFFFWIGLVYQRQVSTDSSWPRCLDMGWTRVGHRLDTGWTLTMTYIWLPVVEKVRAESFLHFA